MDLLHLKDNLMMKMVYVNFFLLMEILLTKYMLGTFEFIGETGKYKSISERGLLHEFKFKQQKIFKSKNIFKESFKLNLSQFKNS